MTTSSSAELALDADGKFLALRVAINLNIGAYLTQRSAGPGTNNIGGVAGVYTTPAIHHQTTGVFTNTTPTGPYRGAGRPEATFAIERVIDVAAHELGIDPIELRRRNLIPPSAMPFKTGLVFTYDCGDFARSMDLALSARRARQASKSAVPRLARAASSVASASPTRSRSPAARTPRSTPTPPQICVNPDGSVSVFTGSTSMGQGNETAYAQIVCDRLGVPPERDPGAWGDSDALGAGRGNGGSGALTVGGSAVLRATREDRRARPPHRRAAARGRPRGHRAPRRPVHRGRHRPGRGASPRWRETAYQPEQLPRAWSPASPRRRRSRRPR